MRNIQSWITLAFVNLAIVALLGVGLRTKFLFSIPIIDFRNLLSAHSHFAFGGWVTLVLFILLVRSLLSIELQQKRKYQVMLWGIMVCSAGMLCSFPFQGYGAVSIIFSTTFIFFTYAFSWIFIKDLLKNRNAKSVNLLVIVALVCLVISSVGPFSMAFMMATKTGDANSFRDAIYYYLHFQYNGFFTLSVMAILFSMKIHAVPASIRKRMYRFAFFLCLALAPSLFLSLLWHYDSAIFKLISYMACGLIILSLVYFLSIGRSVFVFRNKLANGLLFLALLSFFIKMILQTGTVIPSLGNAVYGFRPIIIGFLHLVFLGLVSFFIFAYLLESGLYNTSGKHTAPSIIFFSIAVIIQELILLVNGIGLMFRSTTPIFGWLLWGAAILLFTGAVFMAVVRLRQKHFYVKQEDLSSLSAQAIIPPR